MANGFNTLCLTAGTMPVDWCGLAAQQYGRWTTDRRPHDEVVVGQNRAAHALWPKRRYGRRERGVTVDPEHAGEAAAIARTMAGDAEAFDELVDRYSSRIFAHLFRLVRSREEAEDLTQEAFLRAYRHLDQLDTSRSFRNWLYKIATNLGLNALRSRQRRGFPVPLDENVASVQEEGQPQVERDEVAERVGAAVDRLPAQAQTLIHLHYHEGMTIREAAEILDMREGAAKVALCRARKRLRGWLVGDEES